MQYCIPSTCLTERIYVDGFACDAEYFWFESSMMIISQNVIMEGKNDSHFINVDMCLFYFSSTNVLEENGEMKNAYSEPLL